MDSKSDSSSFPSSFGALNSRFDDSDDDPLRPLSSPPATDFAENGSNSIIVVEEEKRQADSNPDADDDDIFHHHNSNQSGRRLCKYCYAISRLLLVDVIFEMTSADNPSLLSKAIRVLATTCSYALLYTTLTGHLLWGMAYLMDHGWFLLAASGSVTLFVLSALVLMSYEWMWRWQERMFYPVFNMIRSASSESGGGGDYATVGAGSLERRRVVIHDDEDMEDDLSIQGWMKWLARIVGFAIVWFFFCVANIKIDFWITDLYIMARPAYHPFELQLVNCFEATPILAGASVLIHYAYPPFFHWHAPAIRNGVIATAQVERRTNVENGRSSELDSDASAGLHSLLWQEE